MTFYQFARGVVLSVFKVVFRVRVVGKERVPAKGAYIVAPSHRSILDVPFAAYVTRRTDALPGQGRPVQPARSGGGSSTRSARWRSSAAPPTAARCARSRRCSSAGEPVAIFPEGTRHAGPEIAELFAGAAYLSVKFGVPIVPVGIGGSEHILPKGKVLPRIHRVAVSVGSRCRRRCSRAGRAGARRSCSPSSCRSSCSAASTTPSAWLADRLPASRRARSDASTRRSSVNAPPRPRSGRGSAEEHRRGDVERVHQLPQLARRREVLVLVGDVHRHDAVGRREARDDRLHEILGCARAGGDADDARRRRAPSASSSSGPSMRSTVGQPAAVATLASASVFDELALPITTMASASAGDRLQRGLPVGGGEAEVVAGRGPQLGERVAGPVGDALPVVHRERGLREQRDLRRVVDRRQHGRRGRPRARPGGSASGATASVPDASSWPAWPT